MTLRFIFHTILCIFFAAIGLWLFLQLGNNGNKLITSLSVASYWFVFLIFVFFSWIFYLILHKRSTKAWAVAQFVALLIAIVATVSILFISHEHENQRKAEEEALIQKQESSVLKSEDDDEDSSILEENFQPQ